MTKLEAIKAIRKAKLVFGAVTINAHDSVDLRLVKQDVLAMLHECDADTEIGVLISEDCAYINAAFI